MKSTITFGEDLDPWEPDPKYFFDIRDIARNLSRENRYNGNGAHPISVAHHSILIAVSAVADVEYNASLMAMVGLLHDASEAYMKDMPPQIKQHLPDYKAREEHLRDMIIQQFVPAAELPTARGYLKSISAFEKAELVPIEMYALGLTDTLDTTYDSEADGGLWFGEMWHTYTPLQWEIMFLDIWQTASTIVYDRHFQTEGAALTHAVQ